MASAPLVIPGIPELSAPLVQIDRTVAFAWYRFFIALWLRTGGSALPTEFQVFLQQNGPLFLDAFQLVGIRPTYLTTLLHANSTGAIAVPQVVVTSPFVFPCNRVGTLVVFAAEAELSRDNGATYYKVTLNGGAIPMLVGDLVRVTWYHSPVPEVTFFPMAAG